MAPLQTVILASIFIVVFCLWRNFLPWFSAVVIKEDSVSEFSHKAINLWLGLRDEGAFNGSTQGIICKHHCAAEAHCWAHAAQTTTNRPLGPGPCTLMWRKSELMHTTHEQRDDWTLAAESMFVTTLRKSTPWIGACVSLKEFTCKCL